MTIEVRSAVYSGGASQEALPRRDSTSSNGYHDSPSEDDGYFTSAVSVQHKTCSSSAQATSTEFVSSSSSSTMENNYKKVVWPNIHPSKQQRSQEEQLHHHHQESFHTSSGHATDHPMAWMKNVANSSEHHAQAAAEAMELEVQKRVWDATTGRRLSRSRSKSKNIMERARSFERAAADAAAGMASNHSSRAPSRQGSSSNIPGQFAAARGQQRRRSPSAGRQMAEFWQNEANSRPPSRAARERSVGRVDTSQWEAAASRAKEQRVQPKTPPPKRREFKPPSSPAPPPREEVRPVSRACVDHEETPPPPPPPPPPRQESISELRAIQSLSQEEKEQIVEEWVQQTSTQQACSELEKFAYEIAETVVSTMEKHQQQQEEKRPLPPTPTMAPTMASQRTESVKEAHQETYSGLARATPVEAIKKTDTIDDAKQIKAEPKILEMARKERSSSVARSGASMDVPEYKKPDSHFGNVRTGNVSQKRNFWLRSISTEKLSDNNQGPRRFRQQRLDGESWIRQSSEATRPGSSLGQVISSNAAGETAGQSVKTAVSGWSELSKSKSSAAVLQEEKRARRAVSRDRPIYGNDQTDEVQKHINLSEANTHQVQETVTKWGRATPENIEKRNVTPTRHIGETFSESKVAASEQEANSSGQSAPWRGKANEPSLKVVNVAVMENDNNMRFSESAGAQMANHMKQQQTSSSISSSSMMTSTSMMSTTSVTKTSEHHHQIEEEQKQQVVVSQPPPKSPGPIKKQSQQPPKGKSVSSATVRPPPPSTPPPTTTVVATEKAAASTPKPVSSSSGQVSMLSMSTSSSSSHHQEWSQQTVQQQECIETSSSSLTTTTNSSVGQANPAADVSALPVLSSWLADESSKTTSAPSVDSSHSTSDESIKVKSQNSSKGLKGETIMEVSANKDFLDMRSRMLKEVASLRTEGTSDEEEEDFSTSQEKAAEKAKQERNRELAEIAEMRCRANWQDLVNNSDTQSRSTPTRAMDPELEEARKTIRHAAARWQEREQSKTPRHGTPPSGRNTPSRRIGNLFKKGSEHWNMEGAEDDEEDLEFPAPPTDIEMEVTLPAPPPRDSSKDVMMEYSGNKRKN